MEGRQERVCLGHSHYWYPQQRELLQALRVPVPTLQHLQLPSQPLNERFAAAVKAVRQKMSHSRQCGPTA